MALHRQLHLDVIDGLCLVSRFFWLQRFACV
jgi:hypothetical protein